MTGDGSPRPGWWRSGNGEWNPPERLPPGWSIAPDGAPRSFDPATLPVKRALPSRSRRSWGFVLWPGWSKVAPPVATLVLVGAMIVAFSRGGNDVDTRDLVAVGTREVSTRTSSRSTATTARKGPPASTVAVGGLVLTAPSTGGVTTARPATVSTTRAPTTRAPIVVSTTRAPTTTTAPTTTAAPTTAPTTAPTPP